MNRRQAGHVRPTPGSCRSISLAALAFTLGLALAAITILMRPSSAAAGGTTFYISPWGDDGSPGTTPGNAWQTVAKVNNALFDPGDILLFERGGSWNEDLDFDPTGSAGNPIFIAAYGAGAAPVLRRLTIDGAWTVFDGLTIDHQAIDSDAVRVRAKNVTLRNLIIRNGGADGVDASDADGLLIEDSLIHHFLAGSFTNQADAHGVVATDIQGLTLRRTEIHHVSGDSFQADPSRSPNVAMDILIEDSHFWTGPLAADFNAWNAGEVPGENAIDTKVAETGWDGLPRASFTIRNLTAHGWINDGFISNRAVFNMKEKIEAVFDGVTVYGSEIAFRIRGTRGNANVTILNAVVFDVEKAIRAEDDLQNLTVYHTTFGADIDTLIQTAGGAGGVGSWDFQNNAFLGQSPPAEAADPSNVMAAAADFTDPLTQDYSLRTASNLVDAGNVLPAVAADRVGTARPKGSGYDIGAYEYVPALLLSAFAAGGEIYFGWQFNDALPVSSTWELAYLGGPAMPASPITGILSQTRALTLTGASLYNLYTATLRAVAAGTTLYSDTATVWTSDIQQFLPAVRKPP